MANQNLNEKSDTIVSTAVFSKDGKNRYLLRKTWDTSKKKLSVIMTFPSTADSLLLDQTTMLVINGAVKSGFGEVSILNVFSAINSTNPRIDKVNCSVMIDECEKADVVLVAYGRSTSYTDDKQKVLEMLEKYKDKLYTLLNNRKNLAEAIEKTDDSDYLLSKFKEVENRIKNAKEIIEQYENRIEIERVDEKTVRELIEQLRDYMYNPKNVAQTKYILSKYIEKVVVNNDEATVIFKVLAPVTTTGAIPYEPFECGYEETFTVNRKELFLIYKILETDEELNLIIRRLTTKNDKNTENSHRNIEKLQNQITENHIKTYPTQQNVG